MYQKTRAEGFGAEVRRRVMIGTYVLSAGYYDAYYLQAQKVRSLIAAELAEAFEVYEALLSPTSPTTAWGIGDKLEDPLAMYLSDICTIPANLAGIPAVSLPCGLSRGLPIGLQIMGRHLGEATVLRVARTFEQEFKFSSRPGLLEEVPEDPPTTMVKSELDQFAEFASGVESGAIDLEAPQVGEDQEPDNGEDPGGSGNR